MDQRRAGGHALDRVHPGAEVPHGPVVPSGVATQDKLRLAQGARSGAEVACGVANYVLTLRRDLVKVSEAAGVRHPAMLGPNDVEILDGDRGHRPLAEVYGYQKGWGIPGPEIVREIDEYMSRYDDLPGVDEVVEHEPLKVDDEPNQATE